MGGEGDTYWNGQTHWGAKLQLQLCVIRFITNCLGCYACGRAQPLCLDGLDKRLCLMLKKTRAEVLPRIEGSIVYLYNNCFPTRKMDNRHQEKQLLLQEKQSRHYIAFITS